MEAMKNDIALKQSSASPKNFVWGRRAGFYNSNVLFLFFAFIATYISIKGERTWTVMDRNIYMHELDNKMCSKGFHNTVSKSDLKDSRVYKYIWFTFHNLVWLMLNYANFDKLKKTKVLLT